jgi:hypothetical protein
MSLFSKCVRVLFAGALVALMLTGCVNDPGGGGGGGGGGTTFAPALTNVSDAAPDRVLALSVKINDITIDQSSGAKQSVLGTGAGLNVEMTHRAAQNIPVDLAPASLAVGTYNGATITLAGTGSVTFVDNAGTVHVDNAPIFNSTTVHFTLSPNLTINTSSPMVVNATFSPSSITIDLTTFKATISPSFTLTINSAVTSGAPAENTGLVRMFTGVVSAAPSGTTFKLASSQLANPLTFSTNGGTTYSGDYTGFASIAMNNIVQVQATMQSDGTLLATKVDGEDSGIGGGDLEGVVRTVSLTGPIPSPVGSFTLDNRDAASTAAAPAPGSEVIINDFTTPTVFLIDQQDVDLSSDLQGPALNLLPAFDAVHLRPSQQVSAIYSAIGTLNKPKKLKLRLQNLAGTCGAPSNGNVVNQFLIPFSPPSDSLFVLLTGQTTLTVVRQATSDTSLATPNGGVTLHARGLLFWDDVTNQYYLVADRFTP